MPRVWQNYRVTRSSAWCCTVFAWPRSSHVCVSGYYSFISHERLANPLMCGGQGAHIKSRLGCVVVIHKQQQPHLSHFGKCGGQLFQKLAAAFLGQAKKPNPEPDEFHPIRPSWLKLSHQIVLAQVKVRPW